METYLIHPTGVLQGDVLAPPLFVVLVDYLLKKATSQLDSGAVTHPCRSRQHPAKSLNDLDFADIALLESWISQAQAQLSKTAEAAANLGLNCHQCTKDKVCDCELQPTASPSGLWRSNQPWIRILDTLVAWWHMAQVKWPQKAKVTCLVCVLEARTALEGSAHTDCNKG